MIPLIVVIIFIGVLVSKAFVSHTFIFIATVFLSLHISVSELIFFSLSSFSFFVSLSHSSHFLKSIASCGDPSPPTNGNVNEFN